MKVSYSGVGAKQSLKITFPSKSINNPNRIRITGLSTMPGYSNGNKSRATDVMVGGSKGLKGDTIGDFSTLAIPEPEKERIFYIHDKSDNVIAELDAQGNINAEYLYADGRRVARFEEGKPRYYYHTDQLNNTIAISGKRTGQPTVTKYYVFGDIREEYGTVKDNRYKFTGKELDGTDLYYFGARYYDKSLGRWISPDPASYPSDLNLNDPQTLNPYVYCLNNSLRYIDPTAEEPILQSYWWYKLSNSNVYLTESEQTAIYSSLTKAKDYYGQIGLSSISRFIGGTDFKVYIYEFQGVRANWLGEAVGPKFSLTGKPHLTAIRLGTTTLTPENRSLLVSTYAHEVSHLMGYGENVAHAISSFLEGRAEISDFRTLYYQSLLSKEFESKFTEYIEDKITEKQLKGWYKEYIEK